MIPKLLYICFNKGDYPIVHSSISYITDYGTVFHSYENLKFKDPLLGELILENNMVKGFIIIYNKQYNFYTLQDERNFVQIINEDFAVSYINSKDFTNIKVEDNETISYKFLNSICYGFNNSKLYIFIL